MHSALTIAGSDSSGGAGIQADLKTMLAHHVYGMSAITALTAQNTAGVAGILDVTPDFLALQLDSIFQDIYPEAVKIGMVSKGSLIKVIADKLHQYPVYNIVIDPVMVATSGAKLLNDDAINVLKDYLFSLATVLTPNIPEAMILSDIEIKNEEDMKKAAQIMSEKYQCAILVKGGHQINDANDLLYDGHHFTWFKGKKIDNQNTHGTGCTLSSAIASNLAKGDNLHDAIKKAKDYISGCLQENLDLGSGQGPMDHGYKLK
ncbi:MULTISPECIES: bifunctional hydroxymethylpyrimidine kinase/phosphomethylpyrimidine kinase [Coprobacillaceae]|uniref:bifunctional hydroxymethylpyrimidine kinase/phosphomethylpyrimidine kinase n=1 Tax=Coprobacillus sp. AF33-1AC TaxID=2292032 RepID=UPI001F3C1624|nr:MULTISPECIES: bifunctional hydroxymethylpyrimidine kinase/phosphomethylpyrimidine kinase [Coprobacillaceae]